MVTIKLFGSLRLKTGCKGLEADVSDVKAACQVLAGATNMTVKDFKNCVVMINGKQGNYNSKLKDGDELVLMAAAGGG